MSNPFTAHPQSVNETYWENFALVLRFGIKMTLGGFVEFLHAIFPFMFVATACKLCDELQHTRLNSPGRLKASAPVAGGNQPDGNPR